MAERIAVIADVHANCYALQALLDYLAQQPPVDCILNLGDFVQIGPHPREVAEVVLGDPRFVNIMGNNELSLVARDPSAFAEEEATHQEWTIAQLGSELLGKIRALPLTREVKIGDRRALLRHVGPERVDGELWHRLVAQVVGEQSGEHDWLLFGHTHQPTYLSHQSRALINPGSLGCSQDGRASFCLIEVEPGGNKLAFQRIAYDRSALREDYMRRAVPAREHLLARFHGFPPAAGKSSSEADVGSV